MLIHDCRSSKKSLFFSTDWHHWDSIKTQEGSQEDLDSYSSWKDREQENLRISKNYLKYYWKYKGFVEPVYVKSHLCCTYFWRKSSSNPVFKYIGQLYYLIYLWLSNAFFFLTHSFFNLLENGSWSKTILSMLRVLGSNLLLCAHQMPIYSLFSSSISQCKLTVYVDIITEKNLQLINVSELASKMGKEWCTLLLFCYVFMDKTYTSAFKKKGKSDTIVSQSSQVSLHWNYSRNG